MKKMLLILLVFLLVGCQKTETNPNEYSAYMLNIKGDVESLTEQIYDMHTGEKVNFEVFEMGYYSSSNYTCRFDEKGNPLEIIELTPEGEEVVTWLSEFDDNNRIKRFTAIFAGMEELFDDNNRIKRFTAIFAGMEEFSETAFEQGEDDNVIVNNNIVRGIQRTIYKNDIISETLVTSTFDDSGRVIRVSNDVEVDGLEGYPLYDYNKDGRISDVYWYSEGEKDCHVVIKYNDKGYMSNYRYIINPMNEIELLEFDYNYDEEGNWIEMMKKVTGLSKK